MHVVEMGRFHFEKCQWVQWLIQKKRQLIENNDIFPFGIVWFL